MDPLGLASAAASAIGTYLAQFTSGVVDQAADQTGNQLFQLVSSRLQTSLAGANSLQRFQTEPNNPDYREAVALSLADEINRDPQLGVVLANLMGVPQTLTASGDGNVVNTGTWNNRRGVVATGSATVDQSRHFRLGTGGIVIGIIVLVLLIGGTTTAIIVSNQPAFPELEGNWHYEGNYGSKVALHIADDKFTADAIGIGAQIHCAGTITLTSDQTYLLNATQGVCGRITLTLTEGGKVLMFDEGKGKPTAFVR